MTSSGGSDRLESLSEGPPTAIRPGVGDGIEEIGDTDNPCFEGNGLAGNSIGIARAVPPLVVAPRNSLAKSYELGSTLLEHLRADGRMGLHHRAFFRSERTRLEENRIRDPYFSNVVQRRSTPDQLYRGGIEPQSLGDAR